MRRLEAYIFFNGNCAEAMRFYADVFGGTVFSMTVAESPVAEQMPPGREHWLLHARLDSEGAALMASDWMAPGPCPPKRGFAVSAVAATAAEAKGIFDRLAEGGVVSMEFTQTFYAEGFGMVEDRFGTPWMVMSATGAPA